MPRFVWFFNSHSAAQLACQGKVKMQARSRLTGISNCGISELPDRHISGTLPAKYPGSSSDQRLKSPTGFFPVGLLFFGLQISRGGKPQGGRRSGKGVHQIRYSPVADLIHPPASKQAWSFLWKKFRRKFRTFSLLIRTLMMASFMLLCSMPNRQPVTNSKPGQNQIVGLGPNNKGERTCKGMQQNYCHS
jgi:hypothetical protein